MNKKQMMISFLIGFALAISNGATVFAAVPPVPSDTEALTKVFDTPIGTGPVLLSDKMLQVTPASKGQKGAIWSKNQLDLKRDFNLKAFLYLGDSAEKAGDGITFTLQNDERMGTNSTAVLGDSGMGVGAYSNGNGKPYIHNALSIEFDTYYNSGSSNRMDRELSSNNSYGHVAFVTPKKNNNNYTGEHSGVSLAPTFLSNGTWREIIFSWEASTKTLSYDVSGIGSNSYTIADLNDQFAGDQVYWGFTGSTGAFFAENVIAISELPQKITQTATIENLTQHTTEQTAVTAVAGDEIRLNTQIELSPFADANDYINSKVNVYIPDDLQVKPESILIDGQAVDPAQVTIQKGHLTIDKMTVSALNNMKVSVSGTLKTALDNTSLKSYSTFLSETDKLLSTSNEVLINIPEIIKGEVTIFYQDETGRTLHPSKKITGVVGDPYEEIAEVIADYELVSTTGPAKGVFSKTAQTVTFVYKLSGKIEIISGPKVIQMGAIPIKEFRKKVNITNKMIDAPLVVEDTRKTKAKWGVTATVTQEMTNDTDPNNSDIQKGALKYRWNNKEIVLNNTAQLVYSNDGLSADQTFTLSDQWSTKDEETGLKFKIDSKRVPNTNGTYAGKITWTLQETIQ